VRIAQIADVARTDGVCGFATVVLARRERTGQILQIVEICLECRQQVEVDLSRASMHERRVRPTCDEAEATKQAHQTQTGEATMMADILSVMAPAAAPAVKKAVKRRAAKKAVKKAVKRRVVKKAVKKAVKRRVVKKAVKKAATKRAAKKAVKKAVKRRVVKKAARPRRPPPSAPPRRPRRRRSSDLLAVFRRDSAAERPKTGDAMRRPFSFRGRAISARAVSTRRGWWRSAVAPAATSSRANARRP
jgi:hypothetical protein